MAAKKRSKNFNEDAGKTRSKAVHRNVSESCNKIRSSEGKKINLSKLPTVKSVA